MRVAAGAAVLAGAVLIVYSRSTSGYFFDDDFHWLAQTQSFAPANLFDLSRYDHFYRPVIELYFYAGLALFGCDPFPFHVASVAIHLLTAGLVYAFARAIAASVPTAFLASLFFAVQPGFTDAVTWIGAITDLLPVPFYVLTMWLHVRPRQRPTSRAPAATIFTFVLCHLSHESAATLLPMMLAADVLLAEGGSWRTGLHAILRRWRYYAPFVLILLAYLAIAYVVNTRSYLVREGHYAFGWHALPNILNYILWLYVGQRAVLDYAATTLVLVAVMVWGSPRMRFAALWIVVTLLPVSFFTWENAPRYLYLPAVGFSILLADLVYALRGVIAARMTASYAHAAVIAIAAVLALRFGVFAKKAADSFPARAAAYQRLVSELRRANPTAVSGASVFIDQRFLEGIPELYRQPAAAVGLCLPDVRLEMR
jgi:sorbitol-specific phosphotransferase system component IIC